MYARKVTLKLKPDSSAEFTRKLENDVIPLLRKQKGFQDEIAFTSNGGRDALGISLWDRKESAEAYERGAYPQVQKMLEKVTEGTQVCESYDVTNSTFHKLVAAATT
jgi:hypothetical protein